MKSMNDAYPMLSRMDTDEFLAVVKDLLEMRHITLIQLNDLYNTLMETTNAE